MLTGIIQTGLSALQASQLGLRVTSQNIANADTPGFVRTEAVFQPQLLAGRSAGVEVAAIRRVADQYLAAASLNAQSMKGSAGVRAELLDRAQNLLGDPAGDGSVFAAVDRVFSSFTALATDPQSAVRAGQVVTDLTSLFGNLRSTASSLEALRVEADQRITAVADDLNGLLRDIAELNRAVRAARVAGDDASGAENMLSQLIDRASAFIDLRVTELDVGGVEIRTQSGVLLVGDRAAQLRYSASGAPFSAPSSLQILDGSGVARAFDGAPVAGEIAGLLQARDRDIPQIAEALGGLASAIADALNAAHNENSSAPALAALTGRATGLLAGDPINFTGKSTIGVIDSNGALLRKIEVDFDANQITVDGAPFTYGPAPPGAATIGQFVTRLNQALNGAIGPSATDVGDAAFGADGVLRLTTQGTGAGLAIRQDATTPSDRAGRGFSHFFGLNDLVTRPTPVFFQTGVSGTASGFSGGPIVLRVRDNGGQIVTERSIAPVGTSVNDMITAINAIGTGIGPFAQVSSPNADGVVTVSSANGFSVEVVADSTNRAGISFSALFGIGRAATAGRALELGVHGEIVRSPQKIATARPDLTAALNTRVIERGDARGAQGLAAAKDMALDFPGAGALPAQNTTLSLIASGLAGEVGRRAAGAEREGIAAESIAMAALERRTAVEGVKLDDELVNMTRFQQSYAAASRLIQAAKDMFDVLLNLT